jgi:soluble lytic murein transglycosylase-like protein
MSAQAAQRVTLRSGSDVLCDHVRTVNGQVRLFLAPTEDNYLEVGPGDIVRTVMVPDLPAPSAPAQDATSVSRPKTTAPAPATADLPTLLARAATVHHLDVDLLASVVRAESNGNPWAVSRAGAEGLMQLMPGTAATLGVQDSFVPAQNVAGGTAYLDWLLSRYHDDLVLALAAYNAGPEAVDRYHGVPPYAETRRYVARVVHDFNQRKRQVLRQQAGGQTAAAEVPSRAANE